jgi:hypothetical protein
LISFCPATLIARRKATYLIILFPVAVPAIALVGGAR